MSRVRRLLLFDRSLFVTCQSAPRSHVLEQSDFKCSTSLVRDRREKQYLLLTAWVFLPGLVAVGHPIIFPRLPIAPLSVVWNQSREN